MGVEECCLSFPSHFFFSLVAAGGLRVSGESLLGEIIFWCSTLNPGVEPSVKDPIIEEADRL